MLMIFEDLGSVCYRAMRLYDLRKDVDWSDGKWQAIMESTSDLLYDRSGFKYF